MKTIFLQLSEEKYRILVDGLCLAINETNNMATKELNNEIKAALLNEANELEAILSELGDQVSSQ